jgi:hypothetical protein
MPPDDGSREDRMTFSIRHSAVDDARRHRQFERVEMQLLFLISYPLCLIAAMTGRLALHVSRRRARPAQSVFAEARASVHAAIGYAFNV